MTTLLQQAPVMGNAREEKQPPAKAPSSSSSHEDAADERSPEEPTAREPSPTQPPPRKKIKTGQSTPSGEGRSISATPKRHPKSGGSSRDHSHENQEHRLTLSLPDVDGSSQVQPTAAAASTTNANGKKKKKARRSLKKKHQHKVDEANVEAQSVAGSSGPGSRKRIAKDHTQTRRLQQGRHSGQRKTKKKKKTRQVVGAREQSSGGPSSSSTTATPRNAQQGHESSSSAHPAPLPLQSQMRQLQLQEQQQEKQRARQRMEKKKTQQVVGAGEQSSDGPSSSTAATPRDAQQGHQSSSSLQLQQGREPPTKRAREEEQTDEASSSKRSRNEEPLPIHLEPETMKVVAAAGVVPPQRSPIFIDPVDLKPVHADGEVVLPSKRNDLIAIDREKIEKETDKLFLLEELSPRQKFEDWQLAYFFCHGIVRPGYLGKRPLRCMPCMQTLDGEDFATALAHCQLVEHCECMKRVEARAKEIGLSSAENRFPVYVINCYESVKTESEASSYYSRNVNDFTPQLGKEGVNLADGLTRMFEEAIYVPMSTLVPHNTNSDFECSFLCTSCYCCESWAPLNHVDGPSHRQCHRQRRELACLVCDVPLADGMRNNIHETSSPFHKAMREHRQFFGHKMPPDCRDAANVELYAARLPKRPDYFFGPIHFRNVYDEVISSETMVRVARARSDSMFERTITFNYDKHQNKFVGHYVGSKDPTEQTGIFARGRVEVAQAGYFRDYTKAILVRESMNVLEFLEPQATVFIVQHVKITADKSQYEVRIGLKVKPEHKNLAVSEFPSKGRYEVRKVVSIDELDRHQSVIAKFVTLADRCVKEGDKVWWQYIVWQLMGAIVPSQHDNLLRHRIDPDFQDVEAEWVVDTSKLYGFHPDSSQVEALTMALRERLSLVHGPPDTGKTQVMVNLVALALHKLRANGKRRRILVCAASNAAVGLIASRLAQLPTPAGQSPIKVLRHASRAVAAYDRSCGLLDALIADLPEEDDYRLKIHLFRVGHLNKKQNKKFMSWLKAALVKLVTDADVLCCTCSSAKNELMTNLTQLCDFLIVDEAGQASEIDCITAFCSSIFGHVVMAGDHRQPRPHMLSEELAGKNYDQSQFERLITAVTAASEAYAGSGGDVNPADWMVPERMLRVSYDSHADIVHLNSTAFDSSGLQANSERPTAKPPAP